jgi:hypothetical protein
VTVPDFSAPRVHRVLTEIRQRIDQLRHELRSETAADADLLTVCCLDARLVELEFVEAMLTVAAS